MPTLQVNLKNCHGIRSFSHNFDFNVDPKRGEGKENKTNIIYASNGYIKTSLAKTFYEIENNAETKDNFYEHRQSVRSVKVDDNDIEAEEIFVVKSYDDQKDNFDISGLLVNDKLKSKYESIRNDLEVRKKIFLEKIKKESGFSKIEDVESNLLKDFGVKEGFFFGLGLVLSMADNSIELNTFKYSTVFDDAVMKKMKDVNFKGKIQTYQKRFQELAKQSKYLKYGVFNLSEADKVSKTLKANGFFDAEHKLLTKGGEQFDNAEDFNNAVRQEMNNIFNDEEMVKEFAEIDKELGSNKQTKIFRDFILNNVNVIPFLDEINFLKKQLWINYIKKSDGGIEAYNDAIEKYNSVKDVLKEISDQASKESTKWDEVVKIFNRRFHVPFRASVENMNNAIIGRELPVVKYIFNDGYGDGDVPAEDEKLKNELSQGERKAFYLMNVIFNIENLKIQNKGRVFLIIDDIADDFDYKNKYAIAEFLLDISKEKNFYQIIMTHNFDFFRLMATNLFDRKYAFMAEKDNNEVSIKKAEYINDPFSDFLKKMTDDVRFIALMPFARNVLEYQQEGDEKAKEYISDLDKVLHITGQDDVKLGRVKEIIKYIGKKDSGRKKGEDNKNAIDYIMEVADKCLSKESLALPEKIVLSMASRLNAEKFMLKNIADDESVNKIKRNQTRALFNLYKLGQRVDDEALEIIERVLLVSPNIHLNAFMYEPIIDTHGDALKTLYENTKRLND